jgi:predicted PurR-regulated permease PerM
MALDIRPSSRERRLIEAILVLATIVLFFFAIGLTADAIFYFGDVLLTFFLAWLLAFIVSPIVTRIVAAIPRLPRALATVLVYTLIVAILIILMLVAAQTLANSISQFVSQIPEVRGNIDQIVAPLQGWLDSIGLSQVDIAAQARVVLDNLDDIAGSLVAPLQSIAVASLGAVGTGLIVFFLSIYMVLDRDLIIAFLYRLVPPTWADEARLLQTAVARSFGGFLRGQALMGVVYFLIALATNLLLGLPLAFLSSVAAGLLQMIPFFGPFVSWAPPVLVALVFQPEALIPTLILMLIGWFIVMNVLQPRIMQGAIGIHPIVVLGSVIIGSKIAGIPGAIFGIPIAAVISSFFFHFLNRSAGDRSVAGRAAKRLEEREGKPVRIPREPAPGAAGDAEAPTT